jgi:hypothetical protein
MRLAAIHSGQIMLRDIWTWFGDPVVIRRLRLVCREYARELHPLPLVKDQHTVCAGAYEFCDSEYRHRGNVVATPIFPNGDCCLCFDGGGIEFYNTTAEKLRYYDEALFPAARRLYFDLIFAGGHYSFNITTDRGNNPTPIPYDDARMSREDVYVVACDDGYSIWYDACIVADIDALAGVMVWKIHPRSLGT